ncbi:MAG: hypothetical protein AB8B79_08730 [Granulosicoccus sp.]
MMLLPDYSPSSLYAMRAALAPSILRLVATACFTLSLSACQNTAAPGRDSVLISDIQLIERSDNNTSSNSSDLLKPTLSGSDTSQTQNPGDISPWQELIYPLYAQARQLVEADLNIDLSHIELMLVDDQPINAEVARETQRLIRNQFGNSRFARHFLNKVMKSQAGTYAALFTSRLKAVMVSRQMLSSYEDSLPYSAALRRSALLTLLIHELVHAADDQRYQIHENRALNFRASFAQSATFEGHAQWVTRRICEQQGCSSGLDALDNFMFSRDSQTNLQTQPVEAISRNVLEYSYIEGERFIRELSERPNGERLIQRLLHSPPQDPIQILAPENFPDTMREERNQRLIKASLGIDHPWVGDQWIGVQTSPLKGVNLRADPSRRQAAVDGFTKLIQGMVAMQLYDQNDVNKPPLEVTLLHAESSHTASLFARTLHNNTQSYDATAQDEPLRVRTGAGTAQSQMATHVYRTTVNGEQPYRTAIAVSGPYVVQIAGNSVSAARLDDYAIRVLLNLQLKKL